MRPFLESIFDDDDDGNLYRGVSQANLDYRGVEFGDYRGHYEKETNEDLADYSDVVDLCFRFDDATTSDEDFPAAIEERVDVLQWSFFFAAWAMLGSTENSILLNNGDDYFLYHRFSDDRWVLLPWDADSVYDDANQELFRPTVDQVERFLEHPRYAPDYLCYLQHFMATAFQPDWVDARIDTLEPLFSSVMTGTLRDFVQARRAYIGARLNDVFEVRSVAGGSVCDGIIFADRDTIRLTGVAPGCGTYRVFVNGVEAVWNPASLSWSAEIDVVGVERVEVTTRDRTGIDTRRLTFVVDTDSPDAGPPSDAFVQLVGEDHVGGKAADASRIDDPDSDGNVWQVAEGVDGALLDGRVLRAPNDGRFRERGQSEAVFRIQFAQAGTYRSYYRTRGFNRNSDSIWTPDAFDQAPNVNIRITSSGNFRWDEGSRLTVSQADVDAGTVLELRVGVREFRTEFDAFVLSQSQLTGALLNERVSSTGGSSSPRIRVTYDPSAEFELIAGGAEVVLDASTSHDGSCGDAPLAFLWEKVSGPDGDAIAGAPNEATLRVMFTRDGEYAYRVTATNTRTASESEREVAITVLPQSGNAFLRCDANGDGGNSVSDAIFLLLSLFGGGTQPECGAAADCDADGELAITDAVFGLNHLFGGGPSPPAPFPRCDTAPVAECAVGTCVQ